MPDPFRIFKETNTSPHARCLRTSYGQKISDAFFAFAGTVNLFERFLLDFREPTDLQPIYLQPTDPNTHEFNFGILDLLTFFIPMLLDMLTLAAWRSKNLFVKIGFCSILVVITIPLNLVRIVIAGILAFNPLSLFIIFVIHAVSQYAAGGAELNENVAKLEEAVVFHDEKSERNRLLGIHNTQKFTLKGKPETFDSTRLPQLVVGDVRGRATNHLVGLTLSSLGGDPPPEDSKYFYSEDSGYFYLPLFTDKTNTALTKSAYSFLKLNTWRVTERMERYVEANRDKANAQVDVAYCRQVLALIK